MNYKDYRVTVAVQFTMDVSAVGVLEAENAAEVITENVFRNDFGRAERLSLEVLGVRHLPKEAA